MRVSDNDFVEKSSSFSAFIKIIIAIIVIVVAVLVFLLIFSIVQRQTLYASFSRQLYYDALIEYLPYKTPSYDFEDENNGYIVDKLKADDFYLYDGSATIVFNKDGTVAYAEWYKLSEVDFIDSFLEMPTVYPHEYNNV